MQHADAALAGHGDRHPRLGDRVHRAESSGIDSSMLRVSRVFVLTRLGTMSDSPGCSSTSSKVRPSGTVRADSVSTEHPSLRQGRRVHPTHPPGPASGGGQHVRASTQRPKMSTVRGCKKSPSTRSTATPPTRRPVSTTYLRGRRGRAADRGRAAGRPRGPLRPGDLPGAAESRRHPRAGHRVRGLPRAALLRLGPAARQPAAPAEQRPAPGARAGLRPGSRPLRDLGVCAGLRRRRARHPGRGHRRRAQLAG